MRTCGAGLSLYALKDRRRRGRLKEGQEDCAAEQQLNGATPSHGAGSAACASAPPRVQKVAPRKKWGLGIQDTYLLKMGSPPRIYESTEFWVEVFGRLWNFVESGKFRESSWNSVEPIGSGSVELGGRFVKIRSRFRQIGLKLCGIGWRLQGDWEVLVGRLGGG